jgi:hypothetical protein
MIRHIEQFGLDYFGSKRLAAELGCRGVRAECFPVTIGDETHWRVVWDEPELGNQPGIAARAPAFRPAS